MKPIPVVGTFLIGAVAALVTLAAMNPSSGDAGAPGAGRSRKFPDALSERLRDRGPQEAIVAFDDSAIDDLAREMKMKVGLEIDDDMILEFKRERFASLKAHARLRVPGVQVLTDYNRLPVLHIRLANVQALEDLENLPEILSISENISLHPMLTQSLPLINQPAAVASGRLGSGTMVAIIDGAVNWTNSAFGSCTAPGSANCQVKTLIYFSSGASQAVKDHGTQVAATTLAVAPGAQIASLEVYTGGEAFLDAIYGAVNWSINNRTAFPGATIVAMNLSLGAGSFTSECPGLQGSPGYDFGLAFKQAKNAGIVPVVASGNDVQPYALAFPACAPYAVRVGAVYDSNAGSFTQACLNPYACYDATSAADKIACFSNGSSWLTLLAPGGPISSAGYYPGYPGNCGTSLAAPHVAGAAAVLRAADAFPNESVCKTVGRMKGTGKEIFDPRNGSIKPRIDLGSSINALADNPTYCWLDYPNPLRDVVGNPPLNADDLKAGDYNGDGRTDVFLRWYATGKSILYTIDSNALGFFNPRHDPISPNLLTSLGTTSAVQLVVGDFSGDGKSDLWFMNPSTGKNKLFISTGAQSFTQYDNPIPANSAKNYDNIRVTDHNGDNKDDIFLHRSTGSNRLYRSTGTGFTLHDAPLPAIWVVLPGFIFSGDYNGDSKDDLYLLWKSTGYNRMYKSNGNGTYTEVIHPIPTSSILGFSNAVTGDFNGDSKTDLFLYFSSGVNKVFIDYGGLSPNTWLVLNDRVTPATIANMDAVISGSFGGNSNGNTGLPADDLFFQQTTTGKNVMALSSGSPYLPLFPPHRDMIDTNEISSPNAVILGNFTSDALNDVLFYWKSSGVAREYVKN